MKKIAVIVGTLALLAVATMIFLPWYCQVDTGAVYSIEGVALGGTDPVNYFVESESSAGEPTIAHDYLGTTWQFVSEANRDLFIGNPEKYVPAYGGYCAYGMSHGLKYPSVSESWKIVGDRLFLTYSEGICESWGADQASLIKTADDFWNQLHP